jgi:hypothetical protein
MGRVPLEWKIWGGVNVKKEDIPNFVPGQTMDRGFTSFSLTPLGF